jgi:hypothetical protein
MDPYFIQGLLDDALRAQCIQKKTITRIESDLGRVEREYRELLSASKKIAKMHDDLETYINKRWWRRI